MILQDLSAGVHDTLVDTSNTNFVDILLNFFPGSQAGCSIEIHKLD